MFLKILLEPLVAAKERRGRKCISSGPAGLCQGWEECSRVCAVVVGLQGRCEAWLCELLVIFFIIGPTRRPLVVRIFNFLLFFLGFCESQEPKVSAKGSFSHAGVKLQALQIL